MKRTRKLEATAYHEAGHAVVAIHLRVPVRSASIRPLPDRPGEPGTATLGRVHTPFSRAFFDAVSNGDLSRDRLEARVHTLLAGEAAEHALTGRHHWAGARGDFSFAAELLSRHAGGPEDVPHWMELLRVRTLRMVRIPECWEEIQAVALALLERETLSERQLRAIVRGLQDARAEEERREIERLLDGWERNGNVRGGGPNGIEVQDRA